MEAPASVDLAQETPFTLAHVTVTPAALSIAAGHWSRRIEPRAMKVLVMLARASPAVVARGELNARAWGGRVVGEDAINRTIQTLRRIAADAPPPVPFGIETIPRVGHRLTVRPEPETRGAEADAAPAERSAGAVPAGRRGLIVAGALLAVILLVLALRTWAPSLAAPDDWRITGSAGLDDLPPDARDVAISPDGERLAYRWQAPGGHDRVFVRPTAGGGIGVPVSPPDVNARHPAWSPDGAALAFSTYEEARPCRLYVLRSGRAASPVAACETAREPMLAWGRGQRSLLLQDAPGWNAVPRLGEVRLADGEKTVLTSPPGDSMGDDLPIAFGDRIVFQRQFAYADEGWISRDLATGREHLLWRRRGVAGSVAAPLPRGALAIAWTRAGTSGLDIVTADGRVISQPLTLGPVTAMSAAGDRLLIETDHSESGLSRAGRPGAPLATVRGRINGPVLLPDGGIRFPAIAAGIARMWERDPAGTLRPWGSFVAARIAGLTPSPDGRFTAALVTGNAGREIMLFDAGGRPVYRWAPRLRSLNPAVWSEDGRHLVAPVLDGGGWHLFRLDPFGKAAPRDLKLDGFAVLLRQGAALYAVRAGETLGLRELWRLDGAVRRLPIDLTLLDIVNWRPVDAGVWLPDRTDPDHPRLALRDVATGRVLRSLPAPGLAGPGSGLAADAKGPVYVRLARDAPEHALLTLSARAR